MKTTKRILLVIVLCVMVILRVNAQIPGFEWARNMGGTSQNWCSSVTTDPSGNVLLAGFFSGTTDFDPGPGVYNLTSKGSDDIFVEKLDANGNLLWACSFGDTAMDRSFSLTVDAYGNVYLTGFFKYKVDFDPGPGTYFLQAHNSSTEAFVLKLNSAGNFVWAKQMGSSSSTGAALGYGITLDAGRNVYLCGSFIGIIDFNPGEVVYSLTGSGGYDGFIEKLDENGNFIWVKQLTGAGAVYPWSIKTDLSGNVYTIGTFVGTNDFNPASKVTFSMTSISGNTSDIFVEKLDANGNFAWAKQIGGTDTKWGWSLALDAAGNIYFTGEFYGTVDFDPGNAAYNLTSAGQNDIFIEKMDVSGNFKWVKQIGGVSWDAGHDLALDASGYIYVTGYWYETTDFDPGPRTHFLTADASDDVFIYKSDPAGNMVWVAQVGGDDYDFGRAITVDPSGNIYTTGGFGSNPMDFDPSGSGTYSLSSSGEYDMFVQKLDVSIFYECTLPSGLYVSNLTATTADLNWGTISDAYSYNVKYRNSQSTVWIESEVLAPATTLSLSGLTGETQYEFQVQSVCGEGNVSNFSYSGTFITSGPACVDNYEPNQNMSASTLIPVNTDITGLISPSGDIDWFTFSSTNTNKNVKVTLTNLPADYNITLYNSSGTQIGISQNTGTANETIIYNAKKSDTYYIKVNGVNSAAWDPTHCYTLRASISKSSYKSMDVNEIATDQTLDISVYPNPASTIVNISFNSPSDENITLRFMDLSGQTFKMYNFTAVEGMNQYTIDLSDFRDGLYFIGFTTGSQNYYRKIIIRK